MRLELMRMSRIAPSRHLAASQQFGPVGAKRTSASGLQNRMYEYGLKHDRFLRADDDLALAEFGFQVAAVIAPPCRIELCGHHLEHDDVVVVRLALILPEALRRRARIGREAAEPVRE